MPTEEQLKRDTTPPKTDDTPEELTEEELAAFRNLHQKLKAFDLPRQAAISPEVIRALDALSGIRLQKLNAFDAPRQVATSPETLKGLHQKLNVLGAPRQAATRSLKEIMDKNEGLLKKDESTDLDKE